ncbi:MAG: hypothetical protein IPK74_36650 [Deltaproteobacteria bacterium]|nr:hypothetical protein [Deltaproteobacteria bacterium]
MGTWQTAIDAVVIDADGDRRSDILVPWHPALTDARDPDGFFYGQGFWVSRGVNAGEVVTYEVPDPSGERTYTMVPVDHDGDLITDVWICRGMSAFDSQWVLMHGARGPGAPASGFSYHPTNLSCSVHDELAIEPTPAGQRLLVVPAYDAGEPIDDTERVAYARLDFDLASGVASWHADVLPRDRYQRWHDRGCRNGPAFNALGVPVYSAGLGQDKSIDVNGDGLTDLLRFELATGDSAENQSEIVDDLQFTVLPPDGAWTGPHVCGPSVDTPRDAVIRLWQHTGEGYIDGGIVHEFEGLAHANLALNFAGAQVVDVSDDGLSDLLLPSAGEGSSWTTLASHGDGTFAPRAAQGLPADWPAYRDDDTWEDALAAAGRSRVLPMFLNTRDERANLVFLGDFPDSEDLAYPVNPYWLANVDPDGSRDNQRVVSIVDGLTRETTFTYKQLDVSGTYAPYSGADPDPIGAADYQGVTLLPTGAPLWVVSSMSLDAKTESYADTHRPEDISKRFTHFEYFGATLDRRGRGLLGFQAITRDDHDATTTTWLDTDYDSDLEDYPLAGRPLERVARYKPAADGIKEFVRTSWRYDHKASPLIGGRTLLTYASSVRTRRYSSDLGTSPDTPADLDALVPYEDVELSEQRDPFGTTISSVRTALLGATVTTTATNVVHDTAQWLLGQVGRTTIRSCPHAGDCQTRTTDYHYDPATGLPSAIVLEPGSPTQQLSTALFREEHGNVEAKFETPAGGLARSWTTSWDDEGVNPMSFTNPLGQTGYVVHDPGSGALVARVDLAGTTLRLRYDGFYRETFRARHATPMGVSDGESATTAYLPADASWPNVPVAMRLRSTVAGGSQVTAHLDKLGRTVLRQWQGAAPIEGPLPPNLPAGGDVYQRFHYDPWGRVAEVSVPQWVGLDPLGWDSTEYDSLGRVVRETAADGTVVSTRSYAHPLGLVQGSTQVFDEDAGGHTTRVDYDVDGQPVHAIDANGVGICMIPGAFATTSSVWRNCEPGASGPAPVTTFSHDAYGRVLSETESGWNTRTWSYDALGNVKSFQNGNGDETTYAYDELGRVESVTTVDGASNFVWDTQRTGALTSSASPDGIVRDFVYDAFGRTLEDHTRVTTSGTTVDYAFTYGWGSGERLAQVTYPRVDGETVFSTQMVYDATGRLRAIKDASNGSLIWMLRSVNPREQTTAESVRGGVDTTRTWDPQRGWLTAIDTVGAAGPLQAAEYAWRPDGELDSRAESLAHDQKETFQYDAGGRLVRADLVRDGVPKSPRTTDFDAVGNIVSKTGVGSYSYDGNGTLTSVGSTSIFHDGDGNVVAAGTRTFAWSATGKVRSVTDTQGAASFRYDADGMRVERAQGTKRTISIGGQRYERFRSGTTTTAVTYNIEALGRVVARVERGPTGFGFGLTSTLYGVHDDLLGSTQVLSSTAGDGTAAKTSSYDAWGRARTADEWSGWLKDSDAAAVGVGFTGHRAALDAGLIDMRGRMYDPKFGRFMSRDRMVGDPLSTQSWNGYSYVDNRPLRFVDPSGWLPEHGGRPTEGAPDLCANHECRRGDDGSLSRVVQVGENAGSDSGAGAVGWRDTGMGAYGLGPDQMGGGLSSSRAWVRHGDAWLHISGKVLRVDEVDDYRAWYANRNNIAHQPGKNPFGNLLAFGEALDVAADVTLTVASYVSPAAAAVKAAVTLADTSVAYSNGEADEADLAMAVVDAAGSVAGVAGKAAKLASGGASKTAAEMADDLAGKIGTHRVSGRSGSSRVDIDLQGKAHFDKATGKLIDTPHVHEARIHTGPGGQTNLGTKTTRSATQNDIRIARELAKRQGRTE